MNAPVAPPIKAARYIGERMPRKEDPRLLTGRGQFVDDISLPGMLHVAFARSQIARGDILSIDCAAAKEIPGVHAVMLAADLAYPGFQMMSMYLRPTEVETPLLASDIVRYVGEPIALVIADSRALAEDGAALIDIEYAEQDPVVTITDAKNGPPVHPGSAAMIVAVSSRQGWFLRPKLPPTSLAVTWMAVAGKPSAWLTQRAIICGLWQVI